MRTSSNRMPYLAPQSEIVSLRVESRFMVDSPTSMTATFGEEGVVDGGVL